MANVNKYRTMIVKVGLIQVLFNKKNWIKKKHKTDSVVYFNIFFLYEVGLTAYKAEKIEIKLQNTTLIL